MMVMDHEVAEQYEYEQKLKRAREKKNWKVVSGDFDDGENLPRENYDDFDGDIEAPRKPKTQDLSPPRKRSGEGLSEPESKRQRTDDLSPPRKSSKSDLSPPRRTANKNLSPPRKSNKSEDISPPRRSDRNRDISPPRKSSNQDLSPPRKTSNSDKPPTGKEDKMSTGDRAGLFTTDEIVKEDKDRRKREIEMLKKMDPSEAGQNAKTVYRDKHGRPLSMLNQLVNPKASEESKYEWGIGVVDREAEEEKKRREEEEKGRGYRGISRSDREFDEYKDVVRFGDPLAHLTTKKKKDTKSTNKFYGRTWSNRFGIFPGKDWDGRDRSNGFEAQFLRERNEAVSLREMEMKFAQSDM
eukprot:TRINITY_DN6720_c0_g1_i1.p1 TRINITY_DN6720_c0_g1~~TRINITY_DN6720_c0_g1_i1.p1  ORF type:complete len:354 (-),score=100.48 TRINITY_DN6720_c0_g1_i1:16-1077(-)